jgi:HSP20 family molecular chaperone IbpA
MTAESTLQKQTEQEAGGAERTWSGDAFRPNVDILERADELVLLADLPGVAPGEIDIHFEDGELMIHGRVGSRYAESQQFLLGEFGIGDFYRSFRVSQQIDASKIHAEYNQGVLTLHLPKVEAAKPRKIAVQVSG